MKGFQLKKSPWSWVTWVLRISRAAGSLDKHICLIWTNIHCQFWQIRTCVTYSLTWVLSISRAASSLSSIFGHIHLSDLDKYIFSIWTNTFCNLDKYILVRLTHVGLEDLTWCRLLGQYAVSVKECWTYFSSHSPHWIGNRVYQQGKDTSWFFKRRNSVRWIII